MAPTVVIPKCTITTKKRQHNSIQKYNMDKKLKLQQIEYEKMMTLMKQRMIMQDKIIEEQSKNLTFVKSQLDQFLEKDLQHIETIEDLIKNRDVCLDLLKEYRIKEKEISQICTSHQDYIAALLHRLDEMAANTPLRHE